MKRLDQIALKGEKKKDKGNAGKQEDKEHNTAAPTSGAEAPDSKQNEQPKDMTKTKPKRSNAAGKTRKKSKVQKHAKRCKRRNKGQRNKELLRANTKAKETVQKQDPAPKTEKGTKKKGPTKELEPTAPSTKPHPKIFNMQLEKFSSLMAGFGLEVVQVFEMLHHIAVTQHPSHPRKRLRGKSTPEESAKPPEEVGSNASPNL